MLKSCELLVAGEDPALVFSCSAGERKDRKECHLSHRYTMWGRAFGIGRLVPTSCHCDSSFDPLSEATGPEAVNFDPFFNDELTCVLQSRYQAFNSSRVDCI